MPGCTPDAKMTIHQIEKPRVRARRRVGAGDSPAGADEAGRGPGGASYTLTSNDGILLERLFVRDRESLPRAKSILNAESWHHADGKPPYKLASFAKMVYGLFLEVNYRGGICEFMTESIGPASSRANDELHGEYLSTPLSLLHAIFSECSLVLSNACPLSGSYTHLRTEATRSCVLRTSPMHLHERARADVL
eukprot:6172825-Pleurochrysis_carterae.AAC.1